MSISSDSLQGSNRFLFLFFIYIPINVFLMVLVALLFSATNAFFHLQFPVWLIAVATAVLVFAVMYTFLNSPSKQKNPGTFYYATQIINITVTILMLTLSGIGKLIFRYHNTKAFIIEKPQVITIVIYFLLVGVFIAIPLLRRGSEYITEAKQRRKLKDLKQIIMSDDIEEFTNEYKTNPLLATTVFCEENCTVMKFIVDQNKPDLVSVVIRNNKELLADCFAWNINSVEMLQLLVENGLDVNEAIAILIRHQQNNLVKWAIEQYHPTFTTYIGSITKEVLQQKNIEILDFLIQNGLTTNKDACAVIIRDYVNKDDIESVKLLAAKGYAIDVVYRGMIYSAIYSKDAEMMGFLLQYPFDINKFYDDYTFLEYAVKSGKEEIVALLLTKNPDIKALHTTKADGETNALVLAETYNHQGITSQLKKYTEQQ